MALAAPRSLNEPIGCRFSILSQISAGAPSELRRTSGVRSVTPARRSRAARTSSIVGADRDRMGPETIAISGRGRAAQRVIQKACAPENAIRRVETFPARPRYPRQALEGGT